MKNNPPKKIGFSSPPLVSILINKPCPCRPHHSFLVQLQEAGR
jgi:hypothetical protein